MVRRNDQPLLTVEVLGTEQIHVCPAYRITVARFPAFDDNSG